MFQDLRLLSTILYLKFRSNLSSYTEKTILLKYLKIYRAEKNFIEPLK